MKKMLVIFLVMLLLNIGLSVCAMADGTDVWLLPPGGDGGTGGFETGAPHANLTGVFFDLN